MRPRARYQHHRDDDPGGSQADKANGENRQQWQHDFTEWVTKIGECHGLPAPCLEPATHRRHSDMAAHALAAKSQPEQGNAKKPNPGRKGHQNAERAKPIAIAGTNRDSAMRSTTEPRQNMSAAAASVPTV